MTEYTIDTMLEVGFAAAVERTRAALAEQGFGVLTEIDVAATMQAKLGAQMAPYLILGACNPPLAHRALSVDPAVGALLPCNVVVRSIDAEHTLVQAMNPDVMSQVSSAPELASVAAQARALITAAIESLAEDGS